MMAADIGGVNGGLICKRLVNNALIIVCIDFLNLPVRAFPPALETCFCPTTVLVLWWFAFVLTKWHNQVLGV